MFYFPIITDGHFPSWFPIWGGESFEFFRPVFNVADASISLGVFILLIFQNKFFVDPLPEGRSDNASDNGSGNALDRGSDNTISGSEG
jgi:signal peptidase II